MSPRLTGRDFTRDNDALTSAELLQQMQFRSVAASVRAVHSTSAVGAGRALLRADQDALWASKSMAVWAEGWRSGLSPALRCPPQLPHE